MPNGKTILVMDEDQVSCELMRSFLEPESFKIFMAHNVEDGLTSFKNRAPHLVILSIHMPKISGSEFYSKIAKPEDVSLAIPVLVLTSHDSMKSMLSGFHMKSVLDGIRAEGFMAKPFNPIDLVIMVKKILGQR